MVSRPCSPLVLRKRDLSCNDRIDSMINKKSLQLFIAYGIVLCIILSGPVMYNYITIHKIGNQFFKIGYVLLCIVSILLEKELPVKAIYGSVIFSLFLFLYACATRYNIKGLLLGFWMPLIVLFIYSCLLAQNNEMHFVLMAYVDIMIVISLISLFFWLFGSILDILPGKTALQYIWGFDGEHTYNTMTYKYLYFENPIQAISTAGHTVFRNTGIFVEAPGFASYLIYALCIEFFYKKAQNKKNILIFVLAMASTLSGKGLISLIIILGLYYLFYKKSSVSIGVKIAVSLITIVIGVIGALFVFSSRFDTSSGAARWDHFRSSLITWLHYPLFGAGYSNTPAINKYFQLAFTPKGMSMGLTTLLAFGGIYFLSLYFVVIFLLVNSQYTRPYRKGIVLFSCVAFFDLLISAVGYSAHIIMLIALGYAAAIIKRDEIGFQYEL